MAVLTIQQNLRSKRNVSIISMRHCKLTIKALAISIATSWTIASGSASEKQEDKHPALRHRTTNNMAHDPVQQQACILTKVDVQFEDNTTEEYWECELQGNDVEQAGVTFVTVEGMDYVNLDFQAVSGVTTLLVEDAVIADGAINVQKGKAKLFGKAEPRGRKKKKNKDKEDERRLAPLTVDERLVLAIRVIAPDASVTATASQLRADIFNVGDTDGVNLVERINSCSYGKMKITPFNNAVGGVSINTGVLEVNINQAVAGADRNAIKNAALAAASSKLGGVNLASVFDHVMVCLPPGTATSWKAYGYLNGYVSVYNDNWCGMPSANAHELGHNFGLHHAGESTVAYGDKTGLMGYSYYNAAGPQMCFNPAKSEQLGWYSDKTKTLSFSQGPYQGTLVGVADYNTPGAPAGSQVHLKIPGSPENLYVGFNRATGINAGTQDAPDQVTVQGQAGAGQTSSLYAKLYAGGEFVVTNWNGGNKDLVIRVESIDLSTTPATASVVVGYLSGCTPGVCGSDCLPCAVVTPPQPPTSTASGWTNVFEEGFESGFGQFTITSGSTDAKINTNYGKDSKSSLEIKAKNTDSRAWSQNLVSVASSSKARVDFWYSPSSGTKSGNKFFVEASYDGAAYVVVKTFTCGTDWPVGSTTWRNPAVEWSLPSGKQQMNIRIRTQVHKKAKVNFDNVRVDKQ